MAKERKTLDVYQIHVNYGGGWEYEVGEFTSFYARKRKKEYQQNCPEYPVKIVKKREPKSNYDASQLADINRQIANSRAEWLVARREAKNRTLPSPT
jgi:hypothetical protein